MKSNLIMDELESDSDEGFFRDSSFEEEGSTRTTIKPSDFECYKYIPLPHPLLPKSLAMIEPARMAGNFPFLMIRRLNGLDEPYQ
jgi:hypothetical protein